MATNTVYVEKNDIGVTLTTWIYCAAWQLYALEKKGLRGYIHWPHDPMRALRPYWDDQKFKQVPNMHDWYLEQPHVPTRDAPPRSQCPVWTWEDTKKPFIDLGEHPLYNQPIPEIKEFYRKNVRLNQDVEKRGEALVAKYSIDFAKTIGVTWRGTDCVIDGRPRLPIETYYPFIDDILKDHPDYRIMATAEEEGILTPLLKRYPQAFKIAEFFTTPQGYMKLGDNPERFSTLPGYERGMQPALMVYLFSKCAHYVKNRSSTGAVASWLSNGNIVCLCHDQRLSHDAETKKFAEVDGVRVPLNR